MSSNRERGRSRRRLAVTAALPPPGDSARRTGGSAASTKPRGLAPGIDHVLMKPVDPKAALETVAPVHGTRAPAPAPAEDFDREHLRVMTDKLAAQAEELRVANQRLGAIIDFGQRLAWERDPEILFDSMCTTGRSLLGASQVTVAVLADGGDRYRFFRTSGLEKQPEAPSPGGLLGALLRERGARRLCNADSSPAALGLPAAFPPVRSLLAAAIVSPAHTYGWVCFTNKLGLPEFGADDEQLALILSALVGRNYENGRLYKDLQHRTGELEREVAERRRVEEELRASEERYRIVSELGSDYSYAYRIEPDGRVIFEWLLGAFTEVTGFVRADMPARLGGVDIVHPDDRPRVMARVQTLLAGNADTAEYRIVTKQGEVRWLLDRTRPVWSARERRVVRIHGAARDITDRKRAEQRREAQLAVTTRLMEAPHAAEVPAAAILQAVCEASGWDAGVWWRVDAGALRCAAAWGRPGLSLDAFLAASRDAVFPTGEGLPGQAWKSGSAVWMADVAQGGDYRRRAAATAGALRGAVAFPVSSDGVVVAVMEFLGREPRRADEDLAKMMMSAANEIAEFEKRLRAENAVRQLNAELEQRVAQRTAQLEAVNRELEAFSYSVSHDLRAPLRAITGFSQMLVEDHGDALDTAGRSLLLRVQQSAGRMAQLIDDLLSLARVGRGELHYQAVDLSALAHQIAQELQRVAPQREVVFSISPGLLAQGDRRLLRIVLENLLGNSWKYSSKLPRACITVGAADHGGERAFYVRDDGIGFDMGYAGNLFQPFQRLHPAAEFEGTGIGLATVQRIVQRHGGRIWAEAAVGQGATFYFTVPAP